MNARNEKIIAITAMHDVDEEILGSTASRSSGEYAEISCT